jgi:hypothetical protein
VDRKIYSNLTKNPSNEALNQASNPRLNIETLACNCLYSKNQTLNPHF